MIQSEICSKLNNFGEKNLKMSRFWELYFAVDRTGSQLLPAKVNGFLGVHFTCLPPSRCTCLTLYIWWLTLYVQRACWFIVIKLVESNIYYCKHHTLHIIGLHQKVVVILVCSLVLHKAMYWYLNLVIRDILLLVYKCIYIYIYPTIFIFK